MRDFNHTVNVLVQAYLNDTLRHSDCAACAVGNIIAESLNCKITTPQEAGWDLGWDHKIWQRDNQMTQIIQPVWGDVFVTNAGHQETNPENYRGFIKKQIDSSGYSWQELARIEKAFESTNAYITGDEEDEAMFNGLMAVVDALADIHGIDLKEKQEAKKLFVRV